VSNISQRFKGPAERVNDYFFVYLNSAAFATVLFTGFLLVILARGLRRKKRRAWTITVSILIINLLVEFLRFHSHLTQMSLAIFLLVTLLVTRDEFQAKSDPSTRLRPVFGLFFGFLFFFLVGILLFYFRNSSNVVGSPTLNDVMLTVLAGMIWVAGPVRLSSDLLQDTMRVTLGAFGIFVIIIPLWAYLRRVSKVPTTNQTEKELIKELVSKFGDEDSIGYFATRDDKSFIWTENRKAGIAYRVQNGAMIASGDPIGEYSLWPEAVALFLNRAEEFGWTPGVLGASERGGRIWVDSAGMSAVEIGDEAIIDCEEFTLEGRPMSNVRQTINKARREGFTAETTSAVNLTNEEKVVIRALAKKWRGNSAERGFSMSMDRFLGDIDEGSILVRGYFNNELVGLLYFLPWGRVGFSLDRMQRAPKPLPGLTELMIEEMINFCKANKYKYISLNFAAFRSVIERAEKISAGPLLRTIRTLIKFASGWFQVESLNRFNAKFHPEWNARYLLYPGVGEFTRVVWAALRAEKFIDGFGLRKNWFR
jgi:lysyl-tRNA synthetase class 2